MAQRGATLTLGSSKILLHLNPFFYMKRIFQVLLIYTLNTRHTQIYVLLICKIHTKIILVFLVFVIIFFYFLIFEMKDQCLYLRPANHDVYPFRCDLKTILRAKSYASFHNKMQSYAGRNYRLQ